VSVVATFFSPAASVFAAYAIERPRFSGAELVEGDVYHWGSLMAGALFGSLPVAFIYSFFVEYDVSGMTGSVKE
jgi:ABC-type glycerol-3-phosphate transport system permease component